MKILHVLDICAISVTLAKYQTRLGHIVDVVTRKQLFPYDTDFIYPQIEIVDQSPMQFYRCIIKKSSDYDIVHVHSLPKVLPFINNPTVMNFHGSDLRIHFSLLDKTATHWADKILVSTPNLLDMMKQATWLPVPIDTELFYPQREDEPLPLGFDKNERGFIPYKDMREYLLLNYPKGYPQLEYKVQALSKTSLEALACGIPIQWNGLTIACELPAIHRAENVAKQTIDIYEGMIK